MDAFLKEGLEQLIGGAIGASPGVQRVLEHPGVQRALESLGAQPSAAGLQQALVDLLAGARGAEAAWPDAPSGEQTPGGEQTPSGEQAPCGEQPFSGEPAPGGE